MGVSFVISGLVSKRSELAGLAEHYAQELDRLDADLKHLDATIKLFDPEMDLRTLPPKRFREANRLFRHGEINRLILEVIVSQFHDLAHGEGAGFGGDEEVLSHVYHRLRYAVISNDMPCSSLVKIIISCMIIYILFNVVQ